MGIADIQGKDKHHQKAYMLKMGLFLLVITAVLSGIAYQFVLSMKRSPRQELLKVEKEEEEADTNLVLLRKLPGK